MSTIKTTYIQHPSAASPNLELAADGTVVLPLSDLEDLANVSGSPSDGQVLSYDSGTSAWSPTDGGKLVQVVRATDATTRETSSTSFVDASISVSITPVNASSVIYLIWNIGRTVAFVPGTGDAIAGRVHVQITDSSNVALSGAEDVYAAERQQGTIPTAPSSEVTAIGVVSAGSTSARTYKGRFHYSGTTGGGQLARLKNEDSTAQLIAIEVLP